MQYKFTLKGNEKENIFKILFSSSSCPRPRRSQGAGERQSRRSGRGEQMESSEEDDDFPPHEWITPQSSINSIYQSDTEKVPRFLDPLLFPNPLFFFSFTC